MGSSLDDELAHEDERLEHRLHLPDCWIGRYPVTNGQLREFVETGGYGEERLWPEAIAHERWRDGQVRVLDWLRGRRGDRWTASLAGWEEDPYGLPNHPVVGVSWYEAMAFSRWLTERWRSAGWLPEGWAVGLPSEAEWEKAARGGLETPASPVRRGVNQVRVSQVESSEELEPNPAPRRSFPWAGELDPGRANTLEAGPGTTSAVGCFPGGASPYGCEEMAGNVWELTRSLSGDPPYPGDATEQSRREDLGSDDPRLVRGGGFADKAVDARCAARYVFHPHDRLSGVGFRLLLSPLSSGP